MLKATLYGTEGCPWTDEVKDMLEERKVKLKFIDVLKDLKARNEMVAKTCQYSTPVTIIDENVIIGLDKEALIRSIS